MNFIKKAVLLCIAVFCFHVTLMAQNITMKASGITVKQAIEELQQKSGYSFVFSNAVLNTNRKVNIDLKNAGVEKAVRQIIKGQEGLDYEIQGKTIVIKKAAATTPVATKQAGELRRITGRVVDANGEAVIGATVKEPGSSTGAITDYDGNFTITVPENATLEISYVGFDTREVKAQNGMTITLSENEQLLNEVVVTALGIKKESKALSYNVQDVKAAEIVGVKDASFMNALAGKVAGVQINSSSAGIGGGTKVVMRGNKSISGNNNALYVIDGIPMPLLQTTQPTDHWQGMGQSGDGASMINPDDIESISVLSGAAASALYGSDAQNGVIMITTKRGTANETRISYSNNTSFFSPFVTPEFQNTYGAAIGEFAAWGAKMKEPSGYDPLDFFQTGWNTTNSVSLSTGNDKNQTFLSLAATNAEGIVENNTLARYNLAIRNTSSMLNDKLKLDLAAMYMNIRENNMVSEGQYMNPIIPVYLMAPSYTLATYQSFEMYDTSREFKTQYWPWGEQGLGMQNPYWVINRDNLTNHKNRFLVSGGVTYELVKGLTLAARAKMDYTSGIYEKKYAASTDGVFAKKFGLYGKNDDTTRQLYGDVMLNFDQRFGDFSLNGAIGASIQDLDYKFYKIEGDLNSVANLFSFNNLSTTGLRREQMNYHDQTQSVFATAQLGWQSKLYLDLTGRIDWASALAGTDYSNVAYPSAGLTAILTELLPGLRDNSVLSFLKLRGSYSEVGNAPKRFIPFQTYPFESGTPTTSTTYPNSDIKPERTKAWEVGMESHFWGNKINLNVSLYKTSTYNQLFNPSLSSASGYSSIYINGGCVDNKGIELALTLNQPIGPIAWSSTYTYTINRNKIKRLLSPTTLVDGQIVSQDHLDLINLKNVKSMLTEGGSMGDLYVTALYLDDHHKIYVDYQTNEVLVDGNAGPYKDGFIYAGNAAPKYMMSWRNSFDWKGLSLSFLVNARVGGVGVSLTQGLMDVYGTSKTTADARDAGFVLVNEGPVPAVQKYYQTVGNSVGANYVYSATNVRLAELSLGYDIPIRKVIPWIKGLGVAFTARNLLMFYCKAPYDPELTASTGNGFDGMDYFMLPSTRNMGFSVKVNF